MVVEVDERRRLSERWFHHVQRVPQHEDQLTMVLVQDQVLFADREGLQIGSTT